MLEIYYITLLLLGRLSKLHFQRKKKHMHITRLRFPFPSMKNEAKVATTATTAAIEEQYTAIENNPMSTTMNQTRIYLNDEK